MTTSTLSRIFAVALVASSVSVMSCQKKSDDTPAPTPLASTALYDTLGAFAQGLPLTGSLAGQGTKLITDPTDKTQTIQAGRLAIRLVIDQAEMTLAADPAMAPFFPTLLSEVTAGNKTGYNALLETFTDFVQQAASGQQVYKGLDMVTAHDHAKNSRFGSVANPKTDNAAFTVFLGDVVKAMTSLKVKPSVQAQLGAALESTRSQVVQK